LNVDSQLLVDDDIAFFVKRIVGPDLARPGVIRWMALLGAVILPNLRNLAKETK
jgi:hypothetical protein